jgi:hypothetical protein
MIKNAILMSMLFLLAGLSGCLGDEEPVREVVADPITVAEYNYSFSYQFNNYAPMGMGNTTVVELNQTNMSMWLDVNITSGFHEPVLWDQGSINISVLDSNDTLLWYNQSSGGQANHTVNLSDNFTWNGNLTLRTMADGSDNATDGDVADWYHVRVKIMCEWRDA